MRIFWLLFSLSFLCFAHSSAIASEANIVCSKPQHCILPTQITEQLNEKLADNLADPYSAKLQINVINYFGKTNRYSACGNINAKNKFGAYTGNKLIIIIYDKNNIISADISEEGNYNEMANNKTDLGMEMNRLVCIPKVK